jgi:hypothetical protein
MSLLTVTIAPDQPWYIHKKYYKLALTMLDKTYYYYEYYDSIKKLYIIYYLSVSDQSEYMSLFCHSYDATTHGPPIFPEGSQYIYRQEFLLIYYSYLHLL